MFQPCQGVSVVVNLSVFSLLTLCFYCTARISIFFLIFYVILGGIFAVHLVTYEAIAKAVSSSLPLAFAQFGYYGYPNSKLRLISTPNCIYVREGRVFLCNDERDAPRLSGLRRYVDRNDQLPEECKQSLMKDQKGGHPVRCVFINVQRTFLWKPEFINSNLTGPYLPVLCDSSDPAFQLISNESANAVRFWPEEGLQLDLNNTADGRSFPFQNKDTFIMPVYVMIISAQNVTNVWETGGGISVNCHLNLDSSLLEGGIQLTHDYPTGISFEIRK
jgi:hypothetical protein